MLRRLRIGIEGSDHPFLLSTNIWQACTFIDLREKLVYIYKVTQGRTNLQRVDLSTDSTGTHTYTLMEACWGHLFVISLSRERKSLPLIIVLHPHACFVSRVLVFVFVCVFLCTFDECQSVFALYSMFTVFICQNMKRGVGWTKITSRHRLIKCQNAFRNMNFNQLCWI